MKLHFSDMFLRRGAGSSPLQKPRQDKPGGNGAGSDGVSNGGDAVDPSAPDTASALSRAAREALQYQAKRLGDMQAAVTKLRDMPSTTVSAKQAAAERAAMLKRLLETLKQMMIGATPAQAKAMAAQLKDIAKELAALGKALAGGSAAAGATPTAESAAASAGDAPSDGATPSADGEQVSAADTATGGATGNAVETAVVNAAAAVPSATISENGAESDAASARADSPPPISGASSGGTSAAVAAYLAQNPRAVQSTSGSGNATEKATDDALRKSLDEAVKALRALIAMMKSKLGHGNKDLKAAEERLAELEHTMSQSEDQGSAPTDASSSSTASADTVADVGAGGSADAVSVGSAISVSA